MHNKKVEFGEIDIDDLNISELNHKDFSSYIDNELLILSQDLFTSFNYPVDYFINLILKLNLSTMDKKSIQKYFKMVGFDLSKCKGTKKLSSIEILKFCVALVLICNKNHAILNFQDLNIYEQDLEELNNILKEHNKYLLCMCSFITEESKFLVENLSIHLFPINTDKKSSFKSLEPKKTTSKNWETTKNIFYLYKWYYIVYIPIFFVLAFFSGVTSFIDDKVSKTFSLILFCCNMAILAIFIIIIWTKINRYKSFISIVTFSKMNHSFILILFNFVLLLLVIIFQLIVTTIVGAFMHKVNIEHTRWHFEFGLTYIITSFMLSLIWILSYNKNKPIIRRKYKA